MPIFSKPLPLSLYIHLPWCVQKCPYCDFNSHALKKTLPEEDYVTQLISDFDSHADDIANRPIRSIFFGGGTPSLFSGKAIGRLLNHIHKTCALTDDIEITLEANPGTVEQQRFIDFRSAGINRLSLGVQSLDDAQLKRLGRIHDSTEASKAIQAAQKAGFERINIDIMYGLPEQTLDAALEDLKQAIQFGTTHLSWYQLTLEPNTVFYKTPPPLPPDDTIWDMQQAGIALLGNAKLQQYEVSAYATQEERCRHNVNYWEFGDYLGIGAGAHSKITNIHHQQVKRFAKIRQPLSYLNPQKDKRCQEQIITDGALAFEFMLNALRLTDGVSTLLFEERTGLPLSEIEKPINEAVERKLLEPSKEHFRPTALGKRFLNDLMGMFL